MLTACLERCARSIALACVMAMLVGCANLAPVKTFADETKKIAAAFDPLATGTVEACVEKRTNRTLISTSKAFNAAKIKEAAEKLCKPVADGNKYISEVAILLEAYADTLAALGDVKLPNYKEQFSNLNTAVNGVQIDGKEIIPKGKVEALTSLGEFIARMVTQQIAVRELKALLDQQAGFDAAVDALSAYVRLIYKPYAVENLKQTEGSLMTELSNVEKTEPLAARLAKVALAEEATNMKKAIAAADTFDKAAAKLKAARGEVRASLDDKKVTTQQLFALIDEVRELRKQLVTAF